MFKISRFFRKNSSLCSFPLVWRSFVTSAKIFSLEVRISFAQKPKKIKDFFRRNNSKCPFGQYSAILTPRLSFVAGSPNTIARNPNFYRSWISPKNQCSSKNFLGHVENSLHNRARTFWCKKSLVFLTETHLGKLPLDTQNAVLTIMTAIFRQNPNIFRSMSGKT